MVPAGDVTMDEQQVSEAMRHNRRFIGWPSTSRW